MATTPRDLEQVLDGPAHAVLDVLHSITGRWPLSTRHPNRAGRACGGCCAGSRAEQVEWQALAEVLESWDGFERLLDDFIAERRAMSTSSWDMDGGRSQDAALDEALTAYRVGEHEVRLDVPISEQAGSDAEALALADVVCALHRHVVHKIEDAKEFVKREKARLDTWLEQWTAAHEEQKEAIEARLYEYALDYHDDTKTVKLPHATLRRIAWSDRITWDEAGRKCRRSTTRRT